MELPRREDGDILLRPGELTDIRRRLRAIAPRHDLTTVIACAFDRRTRMLPFIYADLRMAPAGVRAIGAAMADSGFGKTRIVLQQWNPAFRPSLARLDGRIPDLFMVSSVHTHWTSAKGLIRDACAIPLAERPLIVVGGAKVIYEPWDAFSADPADPSSADVVVTGEEYVFLSFLETVLSVRAAGESLRTAFLRARDQGLLDAIPGLVYARGGQDRPADELVDTGIQRLAGDLDELPYADLGYGLLEAPARGPAIAPKPLEMGRVHKYSTIGALVMTSGCRLSCPYCPIPAYNQRQCRTKSGPRIADEMNRIYSRAGIRFFFGTDDNFFHDRERAVGILEAIANADAGRAFHRKVRWGTEVTVHDTLMMREHLPLARKAGLRALWLGVEDMTGALVKKGQSVDKTMEAFRLLRSNRILPMPMLMHHDGQALYTPGKPDGLLNQVILLRKAGAGSVQALMMTPSPGSRTYEESFEKGLVYERVGGARVEPHRMDGNHVIASAQARPWRKQMNLMAVYAYFYNPWRFIWALLRPGNSLRYREAGLQLMGMWGLSHTLRRTVGWMLRLMTGRIERAAAAPVSAIPMRGVCGHAAGHALPGTPQTVRGGAPSETSREPVVTAPVRR